MAVSHHSETRVWPRKEFADESAKHVRAGLPWFHVVFSVQRPDGPAIPLLREVQQEFGAENVTVAIEAFDAGNNGNINNIVGGIQHAPHEVLVISDSDVQLRPDYLKTIVGPPEGACPSALGTA